MDNFIASPSIAPLLRRAPLVRSPETAEKGAVLSGVLLKGKELHVLKPLN